MKPLISTQKQQLRKHCRQIRASLDEETRNRASQAICTRLEAWTVFQHAKVILTYMPIQGEVDLTSLLANYRQKRWVLPRIIPENDHRMVFHQYVPHRLVRHRFGMDEPAADLPIIRPEEIELCLTPGLAFDQHGWRLGYGGGYYDRFLHAFMGTSVGVTFQLLLLDELPRGEFDIPMKWVVTESVLLEIGDF